MDPDRTLTPRGVEQAKALRRFCKAAGIKWDVVFSSDFARALDTVEYVANKKGVLYSLKELRPLGTAEDAFAEIQHIGDGTQWNIGDDTHVLVVTHDPLINKMAAAVCFGFSPDVNNFPHGAMLRVDTHPTEKHPLRWMITPELVESLEAGELIEATSALRESLNQSAKARVVDPLIARLQKSLAKRFRAQAREYKSSGRLHLYHPTAFARVVDQAYVEGVAMAWAQIGKVEEAKKDKHRIPAWLPAAMMVYPRTESELEGELDATSEARIAGMVAMGAPREDIAKMIASWATDRAQIIAEYEVSKAYHSGASDAAKLIGERQGVEVYKAWDIEADACDEICVPNFEDGAIPEDILFQSGHDAPPGHPNCRCSLSFSVKGGGE